MPYVTDAARDLASFLTASPSPYHAVAEAVRRLTAAGFVEQPEDGPWVDGPGGRYLVRDGTVLAWWQRATPGEQPLRIFAAHTDSPGFKVKPNPDVGAAGWRQVGVEVYGGALWNSWLDRDLGLAGRLALYDGRVVPVRVDRPLLRIPQLAIHLDRGVNQGLTLDPQRHLLPVWGLGDPGGGDLLEFLAVLADEDPGDVAAHDLFTYDLTPPATLGRDDELLAAPRLDNLASVHAGITALIETARRDPDTVPVFVGFDHEEIGSDTATGAAGPLLETVLTRLAGGFDARRPAFARSRCLSVDVTHAAHPNHLDKHDPDHLSVPNSGPSLKVNAVQRYATDAPGAAAWKRACRTADVPSQVFVSKNTVPCGSTVGPIMATRLGIRTVDVGIPVLSMHSARELCGVHDPGLLARAGAEFLSDAG
ncbi:aminopeptidase 2 [Pseudonocardia sp. EC080610-09]|uniref:M18 family aminopeptidase n=1 Tax=unclassified Pseudonocardia TaxID=2619320 RepID=UPI0006CB0B03|nr:MULTISPECIES: M18 family aminopeptidase [unclassified Pseudonocardia]ALE75404.1 aminopeptidase 2 [Pseudonocardia sp. EC080625-04]ALL74770.1 aminopeptidase 2 [Pseudonocardia sp. EC080610-09]ALL81793.1 aminopeptidase 2 [Pseudonocardia sp. EC080619-01]